MCLPATIACDIQFVTASVAAHRSLGSLVLQPFFPAPRRPIHKCLPLGKVGDIWEP